MVCLRIERGALDGTAREARLFPLAFMRASKPPGPKLLLLDFLRLAANELVTSTVAFSFSNALLTSVWAPIDLRVRLVAGKVASAGAIMRN